MARPSMIVSPEAMKQMNVAIVEQEYKMRLLLASVKSLSPADRRRILAEANAIINGLDEFFVQYFENWVPWHYINGSNIGIEDLQKIGVSVKVKELTDLDYGVMQLTVNTAVGNLRESMTVFKKSVSGIIDDATRAGIEQQMAKEIIPTRDIFKAQDLVKKALKEDGLYVLRDRAGREWDIDRHTEMLTRTELANSSREGRVNRFMQNEQDVVQIDGYGTTCEICAPWENKVISLTGNTRGLPTLQDAINDGVFHPNCLHNYNAYNQELVDL